MYNISQIISLPVISIYESCNVGIITEVLFDNATKKAIALCIVDENEISIKKSIKMISDKHKIMSIRAQALSLVFL